MCIKTRSAFSIAFLMLVICRDMSANVLPEAPTTMQIAAEIGLTAESTVIANVFTYADTILLRIDGATTERHVLAQCKLNVQSALEAVVAADGESSEADEQLTLARTQLNSARAALFDMATEGLGEDDIAALTNWRIAAAFQVPAEFRVLTKTHDEWSSIEHAVRAEARCLRRGETLPSEQSALLGNIRAEFAVSQAASRLQINLDSTQSVFENYHETEE